MEEVLAHLVLVGAIFAFIGLIFFIVWLVGPGREIAGVDAAHDVWSSFSFRPPRGRAYRLWARIVVNCDEDRARIEAELEVRAQGQILHPRGSAPIGRTRWWVSSGGGEGRTSGSFTLQLFTLPPLEAGTPIEIAVCLRGVNGTPIHSARVYVAT